MQAEAKFIGCKIAYEIAIRDQDTMLKVPVENHV